MDSAYKLKKEYSESGLPTVIADEELKIIWKNDIDGNAPDLGESAEFIFDGGIPVMGLVTKEINGRFCTFNVIGTHDGDGRACYIIEFISSQGIFFAEAVRGYVSYICSKIRTAAGEIISVTDRLFDGISAGSLGAGRTAEGFDRIYESAAMLEREIAYPDRMYSLIDPEKPDDIIILDKEMTAVSAGIKKYLTNRYESSSAETVRISEDYGRNIFFRMNADSFETAVASMTAECCGAGKHPERIIFSARRSGRNRAEIAVMSLYLSGAAKDGVCSVCGEKSGFDRRLLSEYIYHVLSLKNGARFSKENIPGGCICRMNIEALQGGASVFAEKPVDGSGRQYAIMDKLAFFFGDISETEKRRYTLRIENKNEPETVCNNYREDIENEKSKI